MFEWLKKPFVTLESIHNDVRFVIEHMAALARLAASPPPRPERRAVVMLLVFGANRDGLPCTYADVAVLSDRQVPSGPGPSLMLKTLLQQPLHDLTMVVLADPERVRVGAICVGINVCSLGGAPVARYPRAEPGMQVSALVQFHDV